MADEASTLRVVPDSRTELRERLDELRRWHEATLGREGRILVLEREVNARPEAGPPDSIRHPSTMSGPQRATDGSGPEGDRSDKT